MGVKQSKRSVDITETSTKGEIEGFGNEGKVEKIIDGVVEKIAANGHVDGELQNGIEPLQNGVEVIQNGEAAAVSATEISEKQDVEESSVEGVANGQVEVNGEVNGDAEKTEEGKKPDEKKEKKKKEKVKKKLSLRNFSFLRKDKSKPLKEEKSGGKVNEAETEEVVMSPEQEITSQEQIVVTPDAGNLEELTKPVVDIQISNATITVAPSKVEMDVPEKLVEASTKMPEDLPPPLPASPPPSEPVEGKLVAELDKLDLSQPASEESSGQISEVASSFSNILTEQMETTQEAIKNAEQIAIETGKQIEEKATNLLKTVEERAGESMRAVGEGVSHTAEMALDQEGEVETKEEKQEVVVEETSKVEETVTANPVEISNVGALSPKGEEPTDKHEEGAGESLADVPKDMTDEVTSATIEVSTPDSLEAPATIPPPPVVEAVTGE